MFIISNIADKIIENWINSFKKKATAVDIKENYNKSLHDLAILKEKYTGILNDDNQSETSKRWAKVKLKEIDEEIDLIQKYCL